MSTVQSAETSCSMMYVYENTSESRAELSCNSAKFTCGSSMPDSRKSVRMKGRMQLAVAFVQIGCIPYGTHEQQPKIDSVARLPG